ncbi:MAG: hypothetical protein IPL86_17000 [Flavobacteriales bacterium]|nr:hypothetical protein [Flavobacteriales bacterium]
MAGIDFSELLKQQLSKEGARIGPLKPFSVPTLEELLQPAQEEVMPPQDTRTLAAEAKANLEGAGIQQENEDFNFLATLGKVLDVVGRPVRDLVGAGTAALGGDSDAAGRRLKDFALAAPDIATLGMFDLRSKEGTTGSEILDDLGWKSGTTSEDERRIRVAMRAGMSRDEAMRKFGVYGDRLLKGEVAQEFEGVLQKALAIDPEFDLNTTFADTKRATDAQDFGGLAVEILLDPLTYMSVGFTAAGKAARAVTAIRKVAPKLHMALQEAGTLEKALGILGKTDDLVKGTTKAGRERLAKILKSAADEDGRLPSLFLADNFSAQAREGQRAALVMPGGRPLFKGQGLHDWLSHVGQTKLKEAVDPQLAGMDQGLFNLRPVKWATGGVKSLMQFVQEKFRSGTGVKGLDELIETRNVDALKDVTRANRVLDRFEGRLQRIAKESGNDLNEVRAVVSDTVELSKRLGGDTRAASDAADLGSVLAKNLNTQQRKEVAGIAKGIVWINQQIVDKAGKVPVKLNELNDDTIQYLHRMVTDQAAEQFEKQRGKAAAFFRNFGLDFSSKSKTFKARTETFRGMTLREINEKWTAEFGHELFKKDPIAATRESVRQSNKAISNAKFAASVLEEFGAQDVLKHEAFLKALGDAADNRETREAIRAGRAYERFSKANAAAKQVVEARGVLKGGARQVERGAERAEASAQFGVAGADIAQKATRAMDAPFEMPLENAVQAGKARAVNKGMEVMKRIENVELEIAAAKKSLDDKGVEIIEKIEKIDRLIEADAKHATSNALRATRGEVDKELAQGIGETLTKNTEMLRKERARLEKVLSGEKYGSEIKGKLKQLESLKKSMEPKVSPEAMKGLEKSEVKNVIDSDRHFVLGLMVKQLSDKFSNSLSDIYRESAGAPYAQRARFEAAEKLIAKVHKSIGDADSFQDGLKLARELRNQLQRIAPKKDAIKGVREAEDAVDILENWNEALELLDKNAVNQLTGKVRSAKAEVQKAFQKWEEADPRGWGPEGVADWIKRLQESGRLPNPVDADSVSALDIYRTLGMRLPETFDEVVNLASVAVPAEIANVAKRAVETQKNPHKFIQWYDSTTKWMKATVTQLFPAFFGRNLLENGYKSFVEGNVNPKNFQDAARFLLGAYKGVEGAPGFIDNAFGAMIRKVGKTAGPMNNDILEDMAELGVGKNFEQVLDWFKAHGLLDNKVTSEFGEVLNDGPKGVDKLTRLSNVLGGMGKQLGTEGKVLKTARKLNGANEDMFRVSMFFDRVRKGYSAEETVAEVKRIFFDYKNLTNFESTWMKRGGFFYDFYRNNARYIVGRAFTHPQELKQISKLFEDDPDNPRLDWLSDMGSFTVGGHEVSLGFLPQQQFGALDLTRPGSFDMLRDKARELASAANPMLSGAGEVLFNKDLFTDKPLVQPGGTVQEWTFAPEPLQKLLGIERLPNGRYQVDSYWNLAFQFVPALRRFATTAGSFTEPDRQFWSAMLKNTTGLNVKKRDFAKEDLTYLDKNLTRAQRHMDLVVRDSGGRFRVNNSRLEGRVFSALFHPTEEKMKDLTLQPEIAAVVYPYMTFRENGKVLMTGVLKQKLRDIAIQKFPKEAAFFDTVDIRAGLVKTIQDRDAKRDMLRSMAQERYEQESAEFKNSGELTLEQMLRTR